jgi:general secretion pathway protein D
MTKSQKEQISTSRNRQPLALEKYCKYHNFIHSESTTIEQMKRRLIPICCLCIASLGCTTTPKPGKALAGHINASTDKQVATSSGIPPIVDTLPPAPSADRRHERYSLVVHNVPVRDLLFALARDAGLEADIHPGITGSISMNAVDQPLDRLLARIARQADMHYELAGRSLQVVPDTPVLKNYQVDYVNMARTVSGSVSANTQITNTPASSGNSAMPAGVPAANLSNTRIDNAAKNNFWDSLEKNIKDILRETDKVLPDGSSETVVEQNNSQSATGAAALPHGNGQRAAQNIAGALAANPSPSSSSQSSGNSVVRRSTFREAASVIVNPETGVIAVRATHRQHERINEFIEQVTSTARRQVLIEATIVEVALRDGYEQGIDWTQLISGGTFQLINRIGNTVNLSYNKDSNPRALISFLDTFGTTKVLSSPRLSVLNNQTALLKVVENYVYFNVKADTTSTANVGTSTVYTTTPQTVSVGLVMSVTPQIGDGDIITLNVRPTITSVGKEIADPNPDLKKAGIENLVPVIRTREIESLLRVGNGQIAVLGGLMEERIDYRTQRVPIVGQIPLAGELLTNRNNLAQKSELVVFLRPVVIHNARLQDDLAGMRAQLPDKDFFAPPAHARPLTGNPLERAYP